MDVLAQHTAASVLIDRTWWPCEIRAMDETRAWVQVTVDGDNYLQTVAREVVVAWD